MTSKTIREIKFEKGAEFTTKYILKFDRDWNEATKIFRKHQRKDKQ